MLCSRVYSIARRRSSVAIVAPWIVRHLEYERWESKATGRFDDLQRVRCEISDDHGGIAFRCCYSLFVCSRFENLNVSRFAFRARVICVWAEHLDMMIRDGARKTDVPS